MQDIQDLASDIILGQLRLVIALMDIEDINTNRDKFLEEVSRNVETELKKIGLAPYQRQRYRYPRRVGLYRGAG